MRGVNRVHLVGFIGKDPEVRQTQNGNKVATLSVATSESWVKDGQKQEKTEWHRVVCWNKTAEFAEKYLGKGRQIYVEGKIQTREWTTDKGEKRYTTEIVAHQIVALGSGCGDRPDMTPEEKEAEAWARVARQAEPPF